MRYWLIGKILSQPFRRLQARIDHWVLSRVKREPSPAIVTRRRVYIVPTRFGYGFGLTVFVMLLGAMNYSNSMAFALSFLLVGLGLICMHHTHANLLNTRIRAGRMRPVFVRDVVHFELLLDNLSANARYGLGLGWPRQQPATSTDLAAGTSTALCLSATALQRGWMHMGPFTVSTEFPLGLFHAWSWIELDTACLIYPRPAPEGLAPLGACGSSGWSSGGQSGQEEFFGLQAYRAGDPVRNIHWKSLPKLQTPMVKQFSDTVEQEIWLDWDRVPLSDPEARLCQLTRWVLDAEAAGRPYGLRLPGRCLALGRGEHHQHECLKALALHGLPAPHRR